MFEGLRKPEELMVIVVTLLAYGCPSQAIVHALDLDEGTVARWQERAGKHSHKVHADHVLQGKLDQPHMQADEIRVKGLSVVFARKSVMSLRTERSMKIGYLMHGR